MSKEPFMPLAVPDFLADTLEMDAKEVGAYCLLLMSLWQRKGYLPNDHAKLKRVARIGRDWVKVWAAIGGHFEVDGDRIFNPRVLASVTRVAEQRAVNAQSGARGGRAKALKDKERALAKATISPQQLELEPKVEKREAKASPKKIGKRLPEDWFLPVDWGRWAQDEGWPEQAIRVEAEKFKDFWISKAGKDAAKIDWLATWRNWMRNSKQPKISAIEGTQNGSSKQAERMHAFIAGARGAS